MLGQEAAPSASDVSKPSGKVDFRSASRICRPYHQGTHMSPVMTIIEAEPMVEGRMLILFCSAQWSRGQKSSVGVIEMACRECFVRLPREVCFIEKRLL
jgi:hypothetical protein